MGTHPQCGHGKRLSRCRECGGSAYCSHGKEKYRCKECGGASICKHGKRNDCCKECGGSSYCSHGKQKICCKECGGSQICEHGRQKYQCKECKGSQICEHNCRKDYCKDCGGTQICEHGIYKDNCKPCGGNRICIHNKFKIRCKECGGSALCKSEWCEVRGIPKYNNYCLSCCIQVCPEIQVSRNYKTKERDVSDRIDSYFEGYTWVNDKIISDGCSKRRPDKLLDLGSHIIIVEVDENKHSNYDTTCENKRLMELSRDLAHRPIVFIRFNPDTYIKDGVVVRSCWKVNKLGVMQIMKTKEKEWEERVKTLVSEINRWINFPSEKTIEIVELFY